MGGRGGPGRRANSGSEGTAAPASFADRLVSVVQQLMAEKTNLSVSPWVTIADVRERLGGTRAEQDAAINQLADNRRVIIIPEENQQTLTPRIRQGGIVYGGETNELIRVAR